MRLYTVLFTTAVALLVTSDVAAEKCTIKTTAPTTTDSTAASTTSSYITDASTESTFDNDGSTAASSVDASQATTSGEGNAASAASTTSTASDADPLVDSTEVPTTTTAAAAASTATSTASSSSTASTTTTTSSTASSSSGFCSTPRIRITEVDVGETVENNEDEAGLTVVAIASLPSGGSRIAFQSGDNVIVRELDSEDVLVNSTAAVEVPLVDFADIHADDDGFVLLGTRDAEGGGTLNCGNPSNLCSAPSDAVPCYDMYLVRYDGSTETWATKLTSSSSSLPPYSISATGEEVYMIWWYAHHGRLAFDGSNWAAYFGCALSVSEDNSCINIHQGDRMKVVDSAGSVTSAADSFNWGCSHSGYERITYDNRTDDYKMICKTDSNNRIMPPNDWDTTIYPVDLDAANLGDIVPDSDSSSKKYWATVSNSTSDSDEDNARVHLIHFSMDAEASDDIILGGTDANERAPHLASIGDGGLLAMWEGSSTSGDLEYESSGRTIYAQVLDASTGSAISEKVTVDSKVIGNRYQALKTFPDGSVAYLSMGTTSTSVQVVRFFGC
ncbi:Avr1b-1 Avirulence-like protein [Phytophthora palmivora]|uniref:Avr1b-1 Avirulence-like protein n=2 Tax=Phytophthora palmivora TaxID=4796 RepID=A0A2P4XW59_9STRA|nr:Avr1b-1 Avirulence-like protein [Phytophthora palmivora]